MFTVFTILFFAGVVGASIVITRKIPLVLLTPHQVIDDYFAQETARIHIRVLRIKAWFQRGAYWDPVLSFSLRTLRSLRVILMRLERYSFSWMQTVSEKYEERKAANTEALNPLYWDEVKAKEVVNAEPTVMAEIVTPPKARRKAISQPKKELASASQDGITLAESSSEAEKPKLPA